MERTDFASLVAAPPEPSALPALRRNERTDFVSLNTDAPPLKRVKVNWGLADYFIDFITPFLIFVLVCAVLAYLLNVRYVYTAVHDPFLRVFAYSFVMGVVALNRLIARQGSQESVLYIVFLALVVGLYTIATTEMYGMGSVVRNFMNDHTWLALLFNMSVVIFIWWLVNRLTHECCIDESHVAGDIGIFTATAEKLRTSLRQAAAAPPPPVRRVAAGINEPWHGITAVDPLEQRFLEKVETLKSDFSKRLPGKHPGMALFYYSAPILIVFAVGLRVIQHLGAPALRMGAFYLYVYVFCVLMLLSLTCLRQLRAYFSVRDVPMPGMLPVFWFALSLLMTVMIMWCAAQLPMPQIPPPMHIDYHQRDVWAPHAHEVRLLDVTPTTLSYLDEMRFTERLNIFGRVVMAALLLYGGLKALQFLVGLMLTKRHKLPRFVNVIITALAWLLFRLFPALLQWSLPQRRLRIQRAIALSARYDNPLGRPDADAAMSVREHIAYAYEALCALAMDVGAPREQSQTPLEFLDHFPKRLSGMREEAEEIIRLYTLAAYSPYDMDAKLEDKLRRFWYAFRNTRNHYIV